VDSVGRMVRVAISVSVLAMLMYKPMLPHRFTRLKKNVQLTMTCTNLA
jgi:hypothetical protein